MKIPYKVIDGIVYVDARVEIPEHIFNNIPAFDTNGESGHFLVDHIKPGKATRFFGDVALVFLEPEKIQGYMPAVRSMTYNAPDLGNVQVQYHAGVDPYKKDEAVTTAVVLKDMRSLPGAMTNELINWGNNGLAQETTPDHKEYLRILSEDYIKNNKEEKEPTPEEWDKIIKKFRETPTVFVHSNVTLLTKLGFQKRNECSWYHPLFGMDSEENWMHFDPNTDDIQHVIPKMYHYGYNKGRQNLRYDFKKLLDIPLH